MKKTTITTYIYELEGVDCCPKDVQKLMQAAVIARDKAYAPYSNFQVGAAILLSNNKILTGNNQENAAYPSGLCAERTVIYYASANYPNEKILKIATTASSIDRDNKIPIPPCGACRQAIAEYEQKQNTPIEVYFMGKSGKVLWVKSLLSLLPLAFLKDSLQSDAKCK